MKLWNGDAMSEVASMVGVPLSTDKVTQDRSNHFYARVLIEVDVSKPPMLSFPIRLPSRKVVNQYVVYETFPNYCFHCKEYGHQPFICKKLTTKEREMAELKEENGKDKNKEVGIIEAVAHDTLKENSATKPDTMPAAPEPAIALEPVAPVEPSALRGALTRVPVSEIPLEPVQEPQTVTAIHSAASDAMTTVSGEEDPLSWLRVLPSSSDVIL
ncbi:unnamed protein product [Cuscuta europaea]|uniref:DUF4283 domain-containing protein n=1 Tax=Cuscuta europaea TaxID=41803 RepID=A0A9P0YHF0_CUSEU|nr:unnamed protein product [Cuscuta europaea]